MINRRELIVGALAALAARALHASPFETPDYAALVRVLVGQKRTVSADYAEVAAALRKARPDLVAAVLAEADLALAGRQILPGTGGQPGFVGDPPRWHENTYNDSEYVWQLNRMNHWPVLLRAHALTGEAEYQDKVILELRDWIEKCPVPPLTYPAPGWSDPWGATSPWRILEVGIRSYGSWSTLQARLLETGLLEPSIAAAYLRSTEEHARALAEISPRVFPHADHNHFVMEMLGLLSICKRLPELDPDGSRLRLATEQFRRALSAQITEGGAQVEASPHYHLVLVDLMAHGFRVAGNDAFGPETRKTYLDALEFGLYATRANFECIPVGDSDPTLDAIKLAVFGHLAFPDRGYLAAARELAGGAAVEATIWQLAWEVPGVTSLLEAARNDTLKPRPRAHFAKGVNQAVVRTGWKRDDLVCFLGCNPPLTGQKEHLFGHSHIDAGGFDFSGFGRPLLVDPGRYTYREGDDRYEFKRAASHNCLLVNDRDPYAYKNRWRFGRAGTGALTHVWDTPLFLGAACEHRHYKGVVCRRIVGIIDGRVFVVLDEVEGLKAGDTVQRYFHHDSAALETSGTTAALANFSAGEATPAVLMPAAFTGADEVKVLAGRISTAPDVAHEGRRLRLETKLPADAPARPLRLLTVFLPTPASAHAQAPALAVAATVAGWTITAGTRRYEFSLKDFTRPPDLSELTTSSPSA